MIFAVIPAKAGTQRLALGLLGPKVQIKEKTLDSRFCGNDEILV